MTSSKTEINYIIFCEDDQDDREMVLEIVEKLYPQLRVEFLIGGVQLMDHLRNFIPDILFLDLEMRLKTGWNASLK